MATAEMQTIQVTGESGRRPTDEELDLFGITDAGKVRPDNQDHFLLATVHPQVVVHGSSLPDVDTLPLRGSRFGTVALVADGVGGAAAGSDAARLATETVAKYVSSTLRCYHTAGSANNDEFYRALKEAALQAHDAVRAEAASRPEQRRMATTLTVIVAVWPWMYVVQVGDSRCYVFQAGKLKQVTRDQTIGQQLVDEGAMKREQLKHSPLKNVLSSAIGADEATPEVTRVDIGVRGNVTLLCSDGLTKHVTDAEIEQHLATMTSSEQACRDLLQLALERGGTDNITIVIGRAPLKSRHKGA
jgi:serine/threonine protein phosphatase PrpC